jgi:hypothetical protein
MDCRYCKKEAKNLNSLTQHEIRCRSNPNRLILDLSGEKNPMFGKLGGNQFTLAEKNNLEKPIVTQETRNRIGVSNTGKLWTNETREKLSNSMIEATRKYPESYSVNNVSGRTKMYKAIDTEGNLVNVKGTWEMLFAEYLNDNLIKWTNKIEEKFEYAWEGKTRIYYPDFYLNDYNTYIEVKGYTRERDLVKWEIPEIRDRLIKVKLKEIKEIKSGNFELLDLLK